MFGSDLKLSPNSFFVSKFIFLPQKSFFVSKFTFWTWTHLIILVFLFSYFLSYTVLFSDYHSLITFLIYHSFHASPSFKCLFWLKMIVQSVCEHLAKTAYPGKISFLRYWAVSKLFLSPNSIFEWSWAKSWVFGHFLQYILLILHIMIDKHDI